MEGLDPAQLLHQLVFWTGRRSATGRAADAAAKDLVCLAGVLALGVGLVLGGVGAAGDREPQRPRD
jgi:hypothetical protein